MLYEGINLKKKRYFCIYLHCCNLLNIFAISETQSRFVENEALHQKGYNGKTRKGKLLTS